ncbi:MAG: hypothetical protein ABTQ29_00645 [Siculibacillus sp.]
MWAIHVSAAPSPRFRPFDEAIFTISHHREGGSRRSEIAAENRRERAVARGEGRGRALVSPAFFSTRLSLRQRYDAFNGVT